ncbi:MAG: hypothetical protein HQL57_03600 [Magnetococcales bacterium]|nr:hypothetical protein [Magnetococcales bacterium]MBF0156254.1 hypothetical protein [Magnetococcales bacterium]
MKGLFHGTTNLDSLYRVPRSLPANGKMAASAFRFATGGPPTVAAKVFRHLGGEAALFSLVGRHPLREFMLADLDRYGIRHHDLDAQRCTWPPLAAVIVSESSGDRAIVYTCPDTPNPEYPERLPLEGEALEAALADARVLLIDGNHWQSARTLLHACRRRGVTTVLDTGSWKPGMEWLLPLLDVVIASVDFRPEGVVDAEALFSFLGGYGVERIAITRGEASVLWRERGRGGRERKGWEAGGEIPVARVTVVNTLGAGDVFHGFFCHAFGGGLDFPAALALAAEAATEYCTADGLDAWIERRSGQGMGGWDRPE